MKAGIAQNRVRGGALLAVVGMLLVAFGAHAEESSRTVRLKYRDDAYRVPLPSNFSDADVRFKKEPPVDGNKVYRTALFLEAGSQNYLGLLWNETTGKLYMDLNRNQDLTDDKEITPGSASNMFMPSLDGVKVKVDTPVPHDYRIDLSIHNFANRSSCSGTIRSGWEAETEIGGEPWVIAVIDNLDGTINSNDTLLLYRKHDYKVPEVLLHELYGMPARPEVCIGDRLLTLSYQMEQAGDACDLVVTLSEKQLPSADLEITGEHIERVTLSGPREVVLTVPRGTVKVPFGEYSPKMVYVYDPAVSKCFQFDPSSPPRGADSPFQASSVSVKEGQRATLALGAPLDNRLRFKRTGAQLQFDYELRGIGGEPYVIAGDRPSPLDRDAKPIVTVYKGGQKIASGTFEYG